MQNRRYFRLLAAVATLLALAGCTAAEDPAADPATVVFLVRHAEPAYPPPAAAPRNPPLNEAGRARAAQLRHVLSDAGITRVFSTEYRRSWDTAVPLAERLGLEIEPYDPDGLAELAQRLRATPGRILVSGHSNTTPELVRHLGGDPGPPIDHAVEFDRLYVVAFEPGRPARTVLLRYGQPPMAAALAEATACLDENLSMELDRADVRDVASSLDGLLPCVDVEIDRGVAGLASVKLEEVSVRDALTAICASAACRWGLEPGTPPRLRITSAS